MKIELRQLSESDIKSLYDFFTSIPPENGFGNKAFEMSEVDFSAWVKKQVANGNAKDLKPGLVPQTIFVLYIDEVPVGFSKLRHYLTPELEQHGGHIGYGMHPNSRGKGYGNILLAETLKQAKAIGIERVLMTVNDSNTPSWKMMERNGAVLEKTEIDKEDGRISRFYWVTL